MSRSPFKTTRGDWASALGTVVGITLTLILLGTLSLLGLKGREWQNNLKEALVVQVFLEKDAEQEDIDRIEKWISSERYAKEATYVSPQKAAEIMEDQLQEQFVDFLDEDPINPSFDVVLHSPYANADSLTWIETSLNGISGVETVNYPRMQLEQVENGLQKVMLPLLVISGLFLFIAIAIINLTIRLSIFSKRFLIKSMQLVGATRSFIRRPFIAKVVLHGLISAFLAYGVLIGLIWFLNQNLEGFFSIPDLMTFGVLFAVILVFGVLISWIATWFAVNKYLRLRQDQLY